MALVTTALLDFQYHNGELCLMVKCVSAVGAVTPLNYRVSTYDSRSAPVHTVTAFGQDYNAAMAWALGLRAGMMSAAKEDMERSAVEAIAHLAVRTLTE